MDLQNYEEKVLLGTILFKPDFLERVSFLIPEYFEDDMHRAMFEKILELRDSGKEITPLNVYKAIGVNPEYIADVSSQMTTKSVASRYAKDIFDSGKKKYLREKLTQITRESDNVDDEIASVLEKVKNFEEPQKDFLTETLETLQWKMKNPNKVYGIQSGISEFDEKINGFNGGCLYVCAGRSSMGKSAFMTSCISKIEKEVPVGIISLEMTSKELVNRICCIRSRIPYWVIDRGKSTEEQFDRFAEEVMNTKKLFIDDRGGLNCNQICSKITQMVKENGCKIVFIDHCGLIKVSDKGNLAHEIGKATSAIKSLAKELDIPIVLLCQVNRGVEDKKDMRPQLSDLRDSGRIEEDADCVFFLYRGAYYNTEKEPTRYEDAEIIIQKNRNGANGFIKCHFDNQLMYFYK